MYMKKRYFLLYLGLIVCFGSNAQITITDNDMPKSGDTIRYSITNNLQGIDPALTGANFNWDFSLLEADNQRLDTFFSVSSSPVAYQYYFNNNIQYPAYKSSYSSRGDDILPQIPNVPISITNVMNFVKKSSSKLENVGFGSSVNGFTLPTRKQPIDVEYEFPLDYADSSFSSSAFAMSFPNVAHYGQIMDRETTVDGWGPLITPFGTFDVLRVKSVLTKLDTIYLDTLGGGLTFPLPQEVEYKWLANNQGSPLLKIITTAGIPTKIEYQDSVRVVGVEEIMEFGNVSVFPNPANEFVQINFNSVKGGLLNLNMIDLKGRVLLSKKIQSKQGENKYILNLKEINLASGIYFVELKGKEKFLLQKLIISE